MKNRTDRIQYYEAIFSEAVKAVHELSSTLENYKQMQNKIAELEAYYESDAWMEDYAEDEAGNLPSDLKRGVLSQDGLYNMLEENRKLRQQIKMD